MENINIVAIVESVEKSQSGYEMAIKTLACKPNLGKFTAEEVGLNGQTLAWLAEYGVLKVVGFKDGFICIDSWDDTYKKVSVNIYEINCDICALARNFDEKKKEVKVMKIEKRIANLKEKLAQALADLDEIQ